MVRSSLRRVWTPEEEQALLDLRAKDMSWARIAARLKRSQIAVEARYWVLALRREGGR